MNKNFLVVILLIFCLFSCNKFTKIRDAENSKKEIIAVSDDFVQGSEDIPLLSDMTKIVDDSLGFYLNSESIMSSSYKSKTDVDKIKNFYLETLPQMGWIFTEKHGDKFSLKRENEKLEIEFINQNKNNSIVKFFLYQKNI
jgi:hypothetical protein